MSISISDACRHFKINRSTLYAAMADGRLSFQVQANGRRTLEPSEIERVFPQNRPIVSSEDDIDQQNRTTDLIAVLKDKNRLLMDRIRQLEQDKENCERREAQLLQLLTAKMLTHQTTGKHQPKPMKDKPKKQQKRKRK